MKDMTVAAEEFEHPVEGFQNTRRHHGNQELFLGSIALLQGPPAQEKEE